MSISRKQIKEWGFKYTNNRDRIAFVQESYHLCPLLLNIVKQIPWDTYRYEGNSTFLYEIDVREGVTEYVFQQKHIKSKCYTTPYFLFGGWWYEYTNRGTLYQFMDKTGDIDIRVYLPEITWSVLTEDLGEAYADYDHPFLNEKSELNAYVQHFSSWLFRNIEFYINSIPDENFIHSQPITNHNVDGVLLREKKTKFGILKQFITHKNLLKTQFVCNFNGITLEPIEFIIILNPDPKISSKRIDKLNGVFIDNYDDILSGNISGLSDRHVLALQPSYKHKWLNHVQRIKYLNSIFNEDDYGLGLSYNVISILGIIVLFSDHIMKFFALYEHSVRETIEAMASNFLKYVRTKPKPIFRFATATISKMPHFEKLKNVDHIIQQIDFLIERNADPEEPISRVPTMFTRRGGKRRRIKIKTRKPTKI
jgi:hypothetical protein